MKAVTAEKLRELAALPAGEAGRWLRKNIDPLWGLTVGECKDFVVKMRGSLSRREFFTGEITVSAPDAETAEKLAYVVLDQGDKQQLFKWNAGNPMADEWDDEDWDVVSVKSP